MENNDFFAIYPNNTKSISVTGTACSQNCSHCNRKYLYNMENIKDTMQKGKRDFTSALISGGMNEYNFIPIDQYLSELEVMKKWGWRLNLHTGIINREIAEKIIPLADKISFDLVTDRETISSVYHINKQGSDFFEVFDYLKERTAVVPHLTIGLLGGEIKGEYDVLNELGKRDIKELVFIVFIPTKDTEFELKKPPNLNETEKLLSYARKILPESNFTLGCMRPRGKYGIELEGLCLKYGFNSIVNPSNQTLESLVTMGKNIITKRECCIL